MAKKMVVFRNRVLEFMVFFLVTAIVWGEIVLCRFLVLGKKPAGSRLLWVLGCYTLVWMIGVCISYLQRLREVFAGSGVESIQLSIAQDSSN